MEEYLLLGIILDSFGLDGTAKILSKTQFGDKRYKKGNEVFLYNEKDNSRISAKVENYRHNGLFDYVKFDIINTKEEVENYRHFEVQIIKDSKGLKKGEYFFADLKNCEVYDENNNLLGKVKEVEEFPAQITLRVKRENGKDFLVPFVKFFIKNIDIENKKITINVIEGMLWESQF